MNISYVHTTKNKLSQVPLLHGQVIFIIDSTADDNQLYADFLDISTNTVHRYPIAQQKKLFYGVSSTAANEAAKTVSIDSFVLTEGAWAFVKFANSNTASNITLNISNTGAKALKYMNDYADNYIAASYPYQVMYNGTYYEILNISPELSMSVDMTDGHLYYDFSVN